METDIGEKAIRKELVRAPVAPTRSSRMAKFALSLLRIGLVCLLGGTEAGDVVGESCRRCAKHACTYDRVR